MRTRILTITIIVLCLMASVSFASESVSVKLEAESAGGHYVVVNAEAASGGKYIGIDHTLNQENKNNYFVVYENVPSINSIKMIYATAAAVDATVIVYVEENGQNKEVGTIPFTSSGGWDPFGGQELTSTIDNLNIPEGSKVTMIATGSVNIDYFEFISNKKPETENPKTNDTSQLVIYCVLVILASCIVCKRKVTQ